MNKWILLLLVLLSACTQTETVKVGWIGPLTGEVASLGINAQIAAELARDEINANGGINGVELEIIFEDGACNAQSASKAAEKLMVHDDVEVIIGGLCSPETFGFAQRAQDLLVPVVSYCSSAPGIPEIGDHIFRTYQSDIYESQFIADHILQENYRRVGMLGCANDWCTGMTNTIVNSLEKENVEVAVETFSSGEKDLRVPIMKLRAQEIDVLLFFSYTDSALSGLKTMRELDWNVPLIAGNTWEDPKVIAQITSAQIVKTEYSVPEAFRDEMEKRNAAENIIICSQKSYDTVYTVVEALQKKGNVRDAIQNTVYDGVAGPIQFTEVGDLQYAPMQIITVLDGAIQR